MRSKCESSPGEPSQVHPSPPNSTENSEEPQPPLNGDVRRVSTLSNGAEPIAIQTFHAAFEATTITAGMREIRCDHVLSFAPMEIQLTVALSRGQLANFAYVESLHRTVNNDTISEVLPIGTSPQINL